MAKSKFNFIAPVKPANGEAVPASPSLTLTPPETVPPSPLKSEGEDNYLKTRLIPRGKIKNNPKNKYDMTDIESLAESILHYGLMQPLVVVYIMQDDVYMLETGHRRAAALNKLIDTYANWPDQSDAEYLLYKKYVKSFEKGYPCIVSAKIDDGVEYVSDDDLDNTDPDVIRSEIRLHLTNCEVREIDRARTIARLSKLYDVLNGGKKREEKINVNKQIAADMQITERQVINYKNVSKLIPELQEAFELKRITLKESSRIAQLDEDEQRTILSLLNSENGDRAKINELLAEKAALNSTLKVLQKSLSDKAAELENLHKEAVTLKANASKAPVIPASDLHLKEKNEEIQKKDDEINHLRAQIEALKQEKLKPLTPAVSLSDQSEKEIKIAIALKNSIESSKGALQNLVHIIKEFNKYENHTILSSKELEEELDDLLQLIINIAKE